MNSASSACRRTDRARDSALSTGGMSHDEAILALWLERVPRELTTDRED